MKCCVSSESILRMRRYFPTTRFNLLWVVPIFLLACNACAKQGSNGDVVVDEETGNFCFKVASFTKLNTWLFPSRYDVDEGRLVVGGISVSGVGGRVKGWYAAHPDAINEHGVLLKKKDAICYGTTPTGFINRQGPLPLKPGKYIVNIEGFDSERKLQAIFSSTFCLADQRGQLRLVACD